MTELQDAATFLTIPGWNGSGPGHWQSLWEAAHGGFRRVEQREWFHPSRDEWIAAIEREVQQSPSPVYFVAHSLGCLAVAHWAAVHDAGRIAGALLVAPPWLTSSDHCPKELQGFLPMPLDKLPFRSLLIASENDPYLAVEIAVRLARSWGAEFVSVGRQGHINTASGHGFWSEGQQLLRQFVGVECYEATRVQKGDAPVGAR